MAETVAVILGVAMWLAMMAWIFILPTIGLLFVFGVI